MPGRRSGVALLWLLSAAAAADQGGTPFWTSGQYASQAAVPSSPGWSASLTGYGYTGRFDGPLRLRSGATVAVDARERTPTLSVEVGYASEAKVLGAQPFVGVTAGVGSSTMRAGVSGASGAGITESDTVRGGTDLYPVASLAWARGDDNVMVYLTGNLPVGAYQASRLANVGLGHAAVDAGGGYTFLDASTGAEFSAVVGFTYNLPNRAASYRNGIDSHLDWAASRTIGADASIGVAGYVYYQLTGDSGSGARLGPFKSRVAAIGPELGTQFSVGRQQWQASLRGYAEFWARNRFEGYALFAVLSGTLD
jgi:hypothetical protein